MKVLIFVLILYVIQTQTIKQINVINQTYFSCDENNKTFSIDKFNDDYCDCNDGSDENSKLILKIIGTNACTNGQFYCSNRFYEPKIISTSKVNDGICDCCDGSDEFNLGCPKTCLDLSIKEYDRLMDSFLTLKNIVMNFNEERFASFFKYNLNNVEKFISVYNEIEELLEKKFLIKSYMNKMENTINEEDINKPDENNIFYNELEVALSKINQKLSKNEEILNDNSNLISNYEIYSVLKDLNQECQTFKYKFMECDLCQNNLKCKGFKNNKKYRYKSFGNIAKFEDNIIHFENGSDCFFYNKKFSARIFIECGSHETIVFKEKIDGCHYDFTYTTKLGCNTQNLKNIKNRIKLFLYEIQ